MSETKNLYRLGKNGPKVKLNQTEKDRKIKQYRKEASKKAAIANKRIARLEKNGLKDTPAYKKYLKDGGGKFGVAGKTYNEVQKEVSRLNRFLESQSSTIRGANKVLKDIANNTGIKYKNLTELRSKSAKFFELSSKVEQYLRTVDDMASAIGYQKIWEAINQYTKDANITLDEGTNNIDDMVKSVTDAIKEYEDPLKATINVTNDKIEFYKVKK
jgi:uncharacterized protein YukE